MLLLVRTISIFIKAGTETLGVQPRPPHPQKCFLSSAAASKSKVWFLSAICYYCPLTPKHRGAL